MRFTISREKLQEGLAAVAASIPAKTTLPVLANIFSRRQNKGIKALRYRSGYAVSTELWLMSMHLELLRSLLKTD